MRCLFLALLLPGVAAAADIELVHQGRLLQSTGAVVEGPTSLTVSLWRSETSQSLADRVWTDTFTGLPVHNGYYTVVLGSQAALPSSVLNSETLHVEVGVAGETPLTPRQYLYGVPHAEVATRVRAVASPDASCPDAGALVYDTTAAALLVCDGSVWSSVGGNARSLVSASGVWQWSDGTTAASCRAYYEDGAYHSEGTGLYRIDPDGLAAAPSRIAYCDMSTAPGGWTLVHHGYSGNTEANANERWTSIRDTPLSDPLAASDWVSLIPYADYALVKTAEAVRYEYLDFSGNISGANAHQNVVASGNFSTLFDAPGANNYVDVIATELHGSERDISSGARLYWGACSSYTTALRFETFRDGSYYSPACHTDTYGNSGHDVVNMDFAHFSDSNGRGTGTVGVSGWGVSATAHVANVWVR